MRLLAAAGLVLNASHRVAVRTRTQSPPFIHISYNPMIKIFGHTMSHRIAHMAWWHDSNFLIPILMWNAGMLFATTNQNFPESPLDVTMQGLFYQTPVTVLRNEVK